MTFIVESTTQRWRFLIQGIVQGVGFRPFVYGQALQWGLGGFVLNDSMGVTIEVEGSGEQLEGFQRALREKMPPLARIDTLIREVLPVCNETAFRIAHSEAGADRQALIAPDTSICQDCLRELLDPQDRRYHYPFINCTNCGPRFTIIQNVPYDRAQTTMSVFPMCPECRAEYEDPLSRRFHAQPNACPRCGPQMRLLDGAGQEVVGDERDKGNERDKGDERSEPIAMAAQRLADGSILAIKGVGGYHLACDALHVGAVARLRARKRREAKPFALMVPDLETARQLCFVSEAEARLLQSHRRPIVLLRKREGGPIAPDVAPGYDTLGVMLPYAPQHYLLLAAFAKLRSNAPQSDPLQSDALRRDTLGNDALGNDVLRSRGAALASTIHINRRMAGFSSSWKTDGSRSDNPLWLSPVAREKTCTWPQWWPGKGKLHHFNMVVSPCSRQTGAREKRATGDNPLWLSLRDPSVLHLFWRFSHSSLLRLMCIGAALASTDPVHGEGPLTHDPTAHTVPNSHRPSAELSQEKPLGSALVNDGFDGDEGTREPEGMLGDNSRDGETGELRVSKSTVPPRERGLCSLKRHLCFAERHFAEHHFAEHHFADGRFAEHRFAEGGNGRLVALVMTSGNLSDEPIAYRDEDARRRLLGIADGMLTHNRDIHMRCDDSVARIVGNGEQFLRRSRGYAPEPIRLGFNCPIPIVACGGQLKNTYCLGKGRQAFVSHHIGDLENLETLHSFQEGIAHFEGLFGIQPEAIAYDLHPEYLATKYALDSEIKRKIGVQHHHAHIAGVLAEHQITGPVIGIAADGTGYGTDGAVWGCEIMSADLRGFERLAHLAYVPLPGGEQAVRQPWRMAATYLQQAYGDDFLALDIPFTRELDRKSWRTLTQMIARQLNAPPTSSLGRLFDAVAALLGIRKQVVYEGQAAIELEVQADIQNARVYPFSIRERGHGKPAQLDVRPMIRAIVEEIQQGVARERIAGSFHWTIAEMLATSCMQVREQTGLQTVALSGGVFQNQMLLERLLERLEGQAFQVYVNRRVPANDGGISLGQLAIAAAQLADDSQL